jgi:enoyl-CoA hydratase
MTRDRDHHFVVTETRGPVLLITISRPEVKNAINEATARAIACALDELDHRHELAVGVLTGAGGTFCAGMDLKAFLAGERPAVPGRDSEVSSNAPLTSRLSPR